MLYILWVLVNAKCHVSTVTVSYRITSVLYFHFFLISEFKDLLVLIFFSECFYKQWIHYTFLDFFCYPLLRRWYQCHWKPMWGWLWDWQFFHTLCSLFWSVTHRISSLKSPQLVRTQLVRFHFLAYLMNIDSLPGLLGLLVYYGLSFLSSQKLHWKFLVLFIGFLKIVK